MIRMLAAVAALAAVPALAAAQASTSSSDPAGVTVQPRSTDSYSIVVDVTGKDRATVRQEISSAAVTACRRAPVLDDPTTLRAAAFQACVDQAEWNAAAQYQSLLDRRNAGPERS